MQYRSLGMSKQMVFTYLCLIFPICSFMKLGKEFYRHMIFKNTKLLVSKKKGIMYIWKNAVMQHKELRNFLP